MKPPNNEHVFNSNNQNSFIIIKNSVKFASFFLFSFVHHFLAFIHPYPHHSSIYFFEDRKPQLLELLR